MHIADIQAEPAYYERSVARQLPSNSLALRTVVAVPMLKDDELVGAIVIYRQEVRPFTDKQIELVKNFAAQAVIAIENTRLLNELRQRTDDLSESLEQQTATRRCCKVISSSPGELEPVFKAMLENATRICEAKFGMLCLCEGDMLSARRRCMARRPTFAEQRRREPIIRPHPRRSRSAASSKQSRWSTSPTSRTDAAYIDAIRQLVAASNSAARARLSSCRCSRKTS